MYCGPMFASIQGRKVPTYLRVSRKLASEAPITVTGRGSEASATRLTLDSACKTSASPEPRITRTPPQIATGILGERLVTTGAAGPGCAAESEEGELVTASSIVTVPRRLRARM